MKLPRRVGSPVTEERPNYKAMKGDEQTAQTGAEGEESGAQSRGGRAQQRASKFSCEN